MIPSEQIQEIIEKSDIVSVVSEYVKLDRKGRDFVGLCPFHKEKTASFHVHDDTQFFKCFGCGKGGNVVHFIMQAEGLSFTDAVRYLAERQGIEIRETNNAGADRKSAERKKIQEINKAAARFFYAQLSTSREGFGYRQGRGITTATIKKFGLGYAPDSWDALIKHLATLGFTEKDVYNAGLATQSQKGSYIDRFRHKVMFPIFDVIGNVVAFGGRVLDDSKPKYINSPETPVYTKGKHLYGLNLARQSGSRRVIVVEGYMDCIALHQNGINWAVAALGTALTQEQAKLLKKYFDDVITCFDADAAGENATIRGMDILARTGFNVRVMSVPDGKDPDEFLKNHSPEDFIKAADAAPTLVEYKITRVEKQTPPVDNGSRAKFLAGLTSVLASVSDAVEREMYINWSAKKYGISPSTLKEQTDTLRAGGKINTSGIFMKRVVTGDQAQQSAANLDKEKQKVDKDEKMLLLIMAEDGRCREKISRKIGEDFFVMPANAELYKKLLETPGEGSFGKEMLLASVGLEDAAVISGLLEKWSSPMDPTGEAEKIVSRLNEYKYSARLGEIYAKLASPELDEDEKKKLTAEMNDILKRKRK